MRSDMAKILVERPRRIGFHVRKGLVSKIRKGLASEDGLPAREGIKRQHGGGKFFNENLAPLRRFVRSRIGMPWNRVYAEICGQIDRGNVVQKHVLTHLFEFVLTDVVVLDGQLCLGPSTRWYGTPLQSSHFRNCFYVCPRTGYLREVRRPRPVERSKRNPPRFVRVGESQVCKCLSGEWELVEVVPLPDAWHIHACTAVDVVLGKLGKNVSSAEACEEYGGPVYAVSRRRLRKRELTRFPIPIDLIRPTQIRIT